MYLWHNFKCLCDNQVEMLKRQIHESGDQRRGLCFKRKFESCVSIEYFVTKSKRPKASTYTHSVLFGLKVLVGREQDTRVPIKHGCKEGNLLFNLVFPGGPLRR